MKVLSVNVGMPETVEYLGRRVRTGIFKSSVQGTIAVGQFNLEGEGRPAFSRRQNEIGLRLSVRTLRILARTATGGGFSRCSFRRESDDDRIAGTDLRRGDHLRIGTAQFEVTVPRFPCYKLGVRFGREDILRDFAKSGRCGFYLTVIQTGELAAGDVIEYFPKGDGKTIAQIFIEKMRQKY
jgi:MOSC domain-containing protein YiiM